MTKVEYTVDKNKLTVSLIGEIDHHGAARIRGDIDGIILKYSPRIVILNFGKVTFMDSSGIGLVLARQKICRQIGASLYVESVDKSHSRILSLAGIKTIQSINI